MKADLLPLLSCPACPETDLHLQDEVLQGDRIVEGQLQCFQCKTSYPIRDGIPRFVSMAALQGSTRSIARNFGDAWQLYAEECPNPYTEAQFLEWIEPLGKADFRGRTVLDLGCGLAGFADYAAGAAPSILVGLEISHAIDAAVPLLKKHPNLNLVQGDILHPPFKSGRFDLMYSIGVLHHLDAPQAGFNACLRLLKAQGRFFIWVYGRENNALVVHIVDPLRRIFSRLPVSMVRSLIALPLSMVLFPLLHTVYCSTFRPLFGWLPYYDYFQWLRRYGFRYVWGMVTDQLIPPRTHYLSNAELKNWFAQAGLDIESMTHRNRISWRVLGRK